MISFRFLKLLVLCGLLALGSCQDTTTAKVEDPCAEDTPSDEPFAIGLKFQLWDSEKQAFYNEASAYADYHFWSYADKVEFIGKRLSVRNEIIHFPVYTASPYPARGVNAYHLPIVFKISGYEKADSVCVVAYLEKNSDCQSHFSRYEYYLNGEFVHESSPWEGIITITKP
jgi:hypothetical protein